MKVPKIIERPFSISSASAGRDRKSSNSVRTRASGAPVSTK
jgi:hypothetical protein